RRIVEEHVLGARIRGVDARGVLRGVPLVHGGVVLHAGVAAVPGGGGDLLHQLARLPGVHGAAIEHGAGGEVAVALHRVHELIGHAHRIVGVLEEDRTVGGRIGRGAIVAGIDQRPGLGFFFHLAVDEVFDVGVTNVEDHHLGGAARLAARLDDAG